jgi:hypothetical protein
VTSSPSEETEDFKIFVDTCCVWGKDTPIDSNTFPARKQYGRCQQRMKTPFLLLKINILKGLSHEIDFENFD